ncbi:SusD/RagB family nutrient-binding outer membrane lipoprotein [Sinomicrobium sp. M5D2P17]
MRKLVFILTLVLILSACSDEDYARLNQDPKGATSVPGSFLFTSGVKSLFDQMGSTSVNDNIFRLVAQQWTECQYVTETNYDLTNRSIPSAHWNNIYAALYDLQQAKISVQEDPDLLDGVRANQASIISIVEVYAWQQMVDTFGDIPYTEALQGTGNTIATYDDAATIYEDLLARVTSAYNNLDTGSEGLDDDFIYNGDISQWQKLAASVKFKLAMRLADVNPSLSQQHANEALGWGLIASNNDNFTLPYEPSNTNAHPLYADLVLSGRQDFVPADTFVDYLNDLEDPRKSVFLDDNLGEDTYVGGVYGDFNSYASFTHIGGAFYEPDLPGDLLDFAEISFLLAEAAERGGYNVTGSAEEYYTQGVTASMEYWGLSSDEIDSYLAKPEVDYATAPGTWQEKIGMQFWIAMYNRGFEAWNVWRRFSSPELRLPVSTGNPIPLRFTYPVREYTLNEASVSAAASAIGGDEQQTPIFWDVN